MSSNGSPRKRSTNRQYLMAVVMGTALTALGASQVHGEVSAVSDLTRYCNACWRNARLDPCCWGDCTQEVFCRLMDRVPPSDWSTLLRSEGDDRKELLRAIDAVKKRTQRQRRGVPTSTDGFADSRWELEQHRTEQYRHITEAASEMLSQRQQRIVQMSYEGWSVQEMAEALSLAPERVSDEKYKAIRKLRTHLAQADTEGRLS